MKEKIYGISKYFGLDQTFTTKKFQIVFLDYNFIGEPLKCVYLYLYL